MVAMPTFTDAQGNILNAAGVVLLDQNGNPASGSGAFPKVSATITRPVNTTPYSDHDMIANNTTAGSVTEPFFSTTGLGPVITKVRVKKSNVGVPALIRVHFFDAVYAATSGDNAPYTQSGINSLGSVVVDVSEIGIDNTVGLADVNIPIGAATEIYLALEAEEGFVPASAEAFTIGVWTGSGGGGGSASSADIGATNEAAAATPGATSGLHGLLAGFWTAIVALLPTALSGGGALKVAQVDSAGAEFDYTLPADVQQFLKTTTGLTLAILDTSASGDSTIVSATGGQTTRVHRMKLVAGGATVITIKRGSTVLDTFRADASGYTIILRFDGNPWYATAANEAFVINNSAAVDLDGSIEYVKSA